MVYLAKRRNMHDSTKKWLLRRKLDIFFLYIEAIAMIFLTFTLVFNFRIFVITLGIYSCIALFIGIFEFVEFKIGKH